MATTPEESGNYKRKRLFDLSVAALALVLMSPLILLIGLLVFVFLGKPVLFRQQRPGLNGKLFTLLKFRTMKKAAGLSEELVQDSARLTSFGRLLRSTSLDELPELINVLRGEMSIIGPRPLLIHYLGRYSTLQMRRHEVLPGITGWAQVNGRNAISWDRKFEMDVWYVDHLSFWLDLKILALTMWRIARRDGIDEPGLVGASEFMGSSALQNYPGVSAAVSCDSVKCGVEESRLCR
jgi:sugar transferase EpsL